MSLRTVLFIVSVVIFGGIAYTMSKGMSAGTNIDKREKHWEQKLAEGLKPGATKEELQEFAKANGETLRCYQNGKRQDQCEIEDHQSQGGSRNMPMRLAIIFIMKDDVVVSRQFTTSLIERQQ